MTEPQPRNLAPVVIGIALTCVLLVGLAYLANQRKAADAEPAPQLTILTPADGAALDSPLVIRFVSTRPLELKPSGWGYRSLHLHVWVDSIQLMPAASEIIADSSQYRWLLPGVSRGRKRLHLGWADQAHRPVTQGGSETVSATIR